MHGRVALLVVLVLSGCRCDREVRTITPLLEVAASSGGPWSTSLRVDLGEVWGPAVASQTVFVRNGGDVALSLVSVLSDSESATGRLSGDSLAVGEVMALEVRADSRLSTSAQLLVVSEQEVSATVDVSLRAIPLDCSLPDTLDFGSVVIGAESVRGVVLSNPGSQTATIDRAVLSTVGSSALAFSTQSLQLRFDVPARSSVEYGFVFRPVSVGTAESIAVVRAAPGCVETSIRLVGRGIDRRISWSPAELDCGWQQPQSRATQFLEFTNHGEETLTLSSASVSSSSFALPSSWSSPVVLASGATVSQPIECVPMGIGHELGVLTVLTDANDALEIPLRVSGARPELEVPPSLPFGLVPVSVASRRDLRISNQGAPMSAPVEATNLEIQSVVVTPGNPNTTPGEFVIGAHPATLARGQTIALPVTLVATTPGLKVATLTITTNDRVRPSVDVSITADARVYSNCVLALNESSLEFGVVQATNPRTRSVVMTNEGADVCLVYPSLTTSSDAFRFETTGPLEIAAGAQQEFAIAALPQLSSTGTVVPLSGALELQTSAGPRVVPLRAAAGPSCLGVLPSEIHFGSLGPGVVGGVKDIRLVNLCLGQRDASFRGETLFITDAGIVGSGEFDLMVSSTIPAGGLAIPYDGVDGFSMTSAPLTRPFAVSYSPITNGLHRGALIINLQQGARQWTQVVPLSGHGDGSRLMTDRFRQGGGDPVDVVVLYVADDSFVWSAQEFAAHSHRLFDFLGRAQSDFRLGVVKLVDLPARPDIFFGSGMFAIASATDSLFMTSTTANASSNLNARLFGSGCRDDTGAYFASCPRQPMPAGSVIRTSYSAWRAVTEPTVSMFNGDFLRADARLAVLSLTQRSDFEAQAPDGWGYNYGPGVPWNWDLQDGTDVLRLFQEVKGASRPDLLSWASMTGLSYAHHLHGSRCDFGHPSFDYVYAAPSLMMKASMRATVEDSCPADPAEFAESVERLAEVASGLRTHFVLSAPVDPSGSIEVRVNGSVVPPADSSGPIWSLQPTRNEVRFVLGRTPSPGQLVTVAYLTRTGP